MNYYNTGWYVAYTRPMHERKVAEQLTFKGIESFLPLVKKLRQWSDRRKYVYAPLFPSYIFVKLSGLHAYFESLKLNGVIYFLKTEKHLACVSESLITNLQNIVSVNCSNVCTCSSQIMRGDKMVIIHGPFTGLKCEVIRYGGKEKIIVRIELLGQNVLADFPMSYLALESNYLVTS
jgi:transcription antitermination factor NusG